MERDQIIKALECWATGHPCEAECEVFDITTANCAVWTCKNALTLIKEREEQIFKLENRLKECENGYEGTLHLESCKLHDAEEKVKELTQANDMISESYDHLEKTKDNLLAERARLTEQNERLRKLATVIEVEKEIVRKETRADTVREMQERFENSFDKLEHLYDEEGHENFVYANKVLEFLDQIAKEMLEGTK